MKKIVLFAALFVSSSLFAQAQYRGSAKFVCGRADSTHINAFAVAPGTYFTTINVVNPQGYDVLGNKRFSVALPGQRSGPQTAMIAWALKPGDAMQIDCGDIYKRLNIAPGTFIDGMVYIIGSPGRFDVAGVYTVTDDAGKIANVDVEEITIR
jgi:hypothetical protein